MKRLILLTICFPLLFSACAPDEEATNLCPELDETEQQSIFTVYKDQVILPAYLDAYNNLLLLRDDLALLVDNPNAVILEQTQARFRAAYIYWEYAEPFYFGPAEDQLIEDHVNFFPIDLDALEETINNGFDSDVTERYDRGFPAMDYLLFEGETSDVLTRMADSDVKSFLISNVNNMINRMAKVIEDWQGAFGAAFVNNIGKVDGASLSQLINSYNRHFETIKRNRIGLASGILTLGFKNVEVLEGYYSNSSLELLNAAVEASSTFFLGDSQEELPNSISRFIRNLDLRVSNNLLANEMKISIDEYTQALSTFDSNLADAIINDEQKITGLYQVFSGFVVLAKTDMPTLMCISITYVDNPSDSD